MPGFNYFGMTDKGKVKEFNEDAFYGFVHKDVLFLVVADGLGAREGADLASFIAVNEVRRHIEQNMQSDQTDHLKSLIEQGMFWTNRVLLAYRRANDQVYGNFGTTLTLCAINQNKDIVIGHAGNTRLYLLRNNVLAQLTKDHTEAQALVDQGKITKEEMRKHPERATLTKALGPWEDLRVDVFGGKLSNKDIVILCTDGISNMLSEEEIQSVIMEAGETNKACEWLIAGGNQRGGIDNLAVVMTYIGF